MTKLNEYQGKLAMVTGAGDGIGAHVGGEEPVEGGEEVLGGESVGCARLVFKVASSMGSGGVCA